MSATYCWLKLRLIDSLMIGSMSGALCPSSPCGNSMTLTVKFSPVAQTFIVTNVRCHYTTLRRLTRRPSLPTQHVPERAVEDDIGPDARRSSRTLGDGSDSGPSVSSSLGELVFHPIHGQVLVLLVVPLGGDEVCHEADDVQHHSIVSTSLVRSESAWMTHFLWLVALAKPHSVVPHSLWDPVPSPVLPAEALPESCYGATSGVWHHSDSKL
jgi:hypothetical protein